NGYLRPVHGSPFLTWEVARAKRYFAERPRFRYLNIPQARSPRRGGSGTPKEHPSPQTRFPLPDDETSVTRKRRRSSDLQPGNDRVFTHVVHPPDVSIPDGH